MCKSPDGLNQRCESSRFSQCDPLLLDKYLHEKYRPDDKLSVRSLMNSTACEELKLKICWSRFGRMSLRNLLITTKPKTWTPIKTVQFQIMMIDVLNALMGLNNFQSVVLLNLFLTARSLRKENHWTKTYNWVNRESLNRWCHEESFRYFRIFSVFTAFIIEKVTRIWMPKCHENIESNRTLNSLVPYKILEDFPMNRPCPLNFHATHAASHKVTNTKKRSYLCHERQGGFVFPP